MTDYKLTPSQTKTIQLMLSVHGGGTYEFLNCGEVKLTVPALLDNYDESILIITRRGTICSSYDYKNGYVIRSYSYGKLIETHA